MNRLSNSFVACVSLLVLFVQTGWAAGGYRPQPAVQEDKASYTLTLNTQPSNAGSFNRSSGEVFDAGANVYMYYNANTDFVFDYWMSGDTIVSRDRYFYFVMPDHDATLTAVFHYDPDNPQNPDSPDQVKMYTLALNTQPANAGTFSWNNITKIVAHSSCDLYAYPNSDFTFREWQMDGKTVGTDRQYCFQMPAKDVRLVAIYDYNPSNPQNPGKNYWNSETGEVIVDDFTPDYLYDAVYQATGGNYEQVQMITVAGPISQYDWGVVNNYTNCTLLDMSRTYGLTYVPSYNFSDNTTLNAIVLPAGIERIESYAFCNCSNLSSISIHAATPPAIGTCAFEGIGDSIVYVPADALSLYQEAEGWKDFTILPLANQVSALEVNLPDDTDPAIYKDMYIELINTKSGQKQRYVITNRLTYSFNSLVHRTSYNVYLRNAQGDVLGEIDGIDIVDKDVSVTFESLKVPRDLALQVLTPEGQDVTAQTTITWMDAKDTYLTKGNMLKGQMEGNKVKFRTMLPQALGMQYLLPADSLYEVLPENSISITLEAIPQTTIGGKVTDLKTGQPLSGATVTVSQMLNGLYSKAFSAKTDNQGQWSLQVYEAKTDVTASMDDYVSKTQSFEAQEIVGGDLQSPTVIPDFQLKDINGTTISLNLTYTSTDGETQQFYSDYANVAYTVFNETTKKQVTEMNVQYPQIVLMEQLAEGTQLTITATSKNQKFVPVTATATVNEKDMATITLPIVQLGGITATFKQTDNNSIVGILYDKNGRLIKKYDYPSATLTINELQDGDYTLVTMANSQFFNSVATISQFAEAGLREGVDYVKNGVMVTSGAFTTINNPMIPYLDETKLYYTGEGTSVTVNKSQITTGNYLTITGHIDFKSSYADQVSDVKLIVDLPEASAFVDNSVMRGGQTASYTYADNQVVVPLDYYGERVRFCFIPTAGGDFTATGSVQFTLNGKTITQPIGKANYTVKNLSIQVPSIVAKTSIPVSGTAVGRSTVEVYDNGTLLGQTKALANGSWATTVELDNPYNLSTHSIYAKIITKEGVEMLSETKDMTYDMNAIQIQKVTMYHYNPEMHKTFESVFDFQNPHTTPNKWTVYYPNKKFTYTVDFTNNSPEKVSNVILYVHAANGQIVPLYPTYDEKKDTWVADIDMGNRSDGYYPVNVSVDFDAISTPIIDDHQIGEQIASITELAGDLDTALSEIADDEMDSEYNSVNEEDFLAFEELLAWDETFADDDPVEEIDVDSIMQAAQAFRNLFTLKMGSELVMADGTIVTTRTCEDIDEGSLVAQGFSKYETTSGNSIYTLSEGNVSIVIDYANNLYLKINSPAKLSVLNRRGSATETFKDWADRLKSALTSVQDAYKDMEDLIGSLVDKMEIDFEKYADLAKSYGRNYNSFNTKYENAIKLKNSGTLDPWQLNEIDKKISSYKASRDKWKKLFDAANRSKKITEKSLPIARKLLPTLKKICPVIKYADLAWKGISVIWDYSSMYNSIPDPCEANQAGADNLRAEVMNTGRWVFGIFSTKLIVDALLDISVATQAAAAVPTGGVTALSAFATAASKMVVSIILDAAFDAYNNSRKNSLKAAINALECTPPPPPGDGGGGAGSGGPGGGSGGSGGSGSGGGTGSGSSPDDVQIDPSGYVYEGVASNRLQGVTATAYYKETVEDMYGDLHENIVLWDAEEYAQENPLFTDEYGMYQWDVPQGLWQVKFEKEGYQTTYSEWLPVPPPQLEVNIPMTQMLQPNVKGGKAFADGIEFEFDKYMDPETLTADNILVTKNGDAVTGEIKLLNGEVAYEGQTQTYASKVRFEVPKDEELLSTDEVQLTIRKAVKSYAGVPMQDDYTQKFDVELQVRSVAVDSLINVAYGGTRTLTIAALPADAAKGKTMNVKSLSSLIASANAETLTLDENGQAELTVTGELPGSTVLNFTVEGTEVEGLMTVNVKDAKKLTTVAPRASRVSGTEVYRGTKIQLTSETENAVIYYTLDGSCPCDENNPNLLTYNPDEPIIIADDAVTIKAMAIGHDLAESEVSEFTYSLKKSALGYQMPAGWSWISHNLEEPVPTSKFQTNAERIVSQTAEMINDPKVGFIGNLKELLPAEGYKVKVTADTKNNLSGYEFNAHDNAVSLKSGWNWIGYPLSQIMTPDEALAFFTPSTGDYIVGQDGYVEYADGAWKGTLEAFVPGRGYLYKSATETEISFNTTIVSNAVSQVGKRILLNDSPWAYNKYGWQNLMPLTAQLYVEGVKAEEDDFVVGAFAGTECRGIGCWKDGRLMMSVYGDGNEDIRFVAAEPSTDKFYDITETLRFTADNVGSWYAPYTLTLGGEATDIKQLYNCLTVTPAVARDHITVNAGGMDISYLALTNMNGVTVLTVTDMGKGGTIATGMLADGMYIVTVQAGGNTYYKKIIKANR